MTIFYQKTAVFRFLKLAELWGNETKTDMWTIARIMAAGTKPSQNECPLILHHISMLDDAGNHKPNGSFRNPKSIDALKSLVNDAPDRPMQIIVDGLHDMCISKENFRMWCVEKYPLPQFWFSKEERTTFSDAEKVQITSVGKVSIEDLKNELYSKEIFELKPSFHGLSVDLKRLYKNVKIKFKARFNS